MSLARLDKIIASTLVISRRDAALAIKKGRVTVDGAVVTLSDSKTDPDCHEIRFDGEPIVYAAHLYLMLNKPAGLICADEDRKSGTVLELFPPEYIAKGIHCVGRLDKDTVGLLLVTNDGALAHRLLAPKSRTEKVYRVTADKPFCPDDVQTMRTGIVIDGKNTAPARLEISGDEPHTALVTLTEGKFHEVKRLCYACGEKTVTHLQRVRFAGLALDTSLAEGEWRMLSETEVNLLKNVEI